MFSQLRERSPSPEGVGVVAEPAQAPYSCKRLAPIRVAFAVLVTHLVAVVGLAGCMLNGTHDLATVQPAVFPLDIAELNTYVLFESTLSIAKGPEGYELVPWQRPEKKGEAFELFDTTDRKGWLYQSKRVKEGQTVYEYAYVEKQRDRLKVLWDPKKDVVSASSQLRSAVSGDEVSTRSARATYAILNQLVQLNALSGLFYCAPDLAIADATAVIARDRGNSQAGVALPLCDLPDEDGRDLERSKAYLWRATAWHAKGEYARAIADLTAVIKESAKDDQKTTAHFRRGIAHRLAGAYDLAIKDLTTAVASERQADAKRSANDQGPTTLLKDALYARALAWRQKGDLDRAIADFDETISNDVEANDAYYHRGLARQAKGDLAGAIADYGEALRILPRYALAQVALQRARELVASKPVGAPGPGEKRVALVIGNAAYRHAPRLANPLNDAQDVAGALQELGFEIVVATDLDRVGMNAALDRFSRIVSGADVALVYFSGHGMQWGNRNFLLPVDARLADPDDVNRFRLLPLDDVLEVMAPAARVRLVLLDACRNNPIEEELKLRVASQPGASRDAVLTRGLVRAPASRGLIIAYSTQANMIALDGTTRNSPFTAAFLKNVKTVDLDIKSMLFRVQDEVDRLTNGKQLPELSISHIGEFKLRPGAR